VQSEGVYKNGNLEKMLEYNETGNLKS